MPPITAWAGMPSAEHEREPAQRRAGRLRQAATKRGDRDRDQHEGQHPVAELDRAVHAAARRAG